MKYLIVFLIGFAVGKFGFQKTVTTTANTSAKVLETGAKAVDKTGEIVDKGIKTGKETIK